MKIKTDTKLKHKQKKLCCPTCNRDISGSNDGSQILLAIIVSILFLLALFMAHSSMADTINMEAIKQIESSGNPNAYNKHSQAAGLYQITPIVLKDFNQINKTSYRKTDLFNGNINTLISTWYMNKRIPQLLKHYHIKDTVNNRLIAYNAGIAFLLKRKTPKETREYIRKYERLTCKQD